MADAAQTPDLALRYLAELSTDIRAAAIIDRSGAPAAVSEDDERRAERLCALAVRLFEGAGEDACQVEVTTVDGGAFAVREHGWSIVAVTGPFALPSLVFYDLRSVLGDLEVRAA